MPSEAIRAAEMSLARAADVVFVTSPALAEQLGKWNASATHYLPNVADYEHFATARAAGPLPDDLAAIPRPRIGFVGAVSAYKVDFELIAATAKARPDWQWVLIGQVGEGQPETSIQSLRLPNVHLLGPRDYRELPAYLRGFDAATIPCRANGYTAAMFPMKFFEYLAAGLPVVAAHVPALAEFSHACELVESQAAFIAALDRVLSGQRPSIEECIALAKQHTWEWRMDEMLAILDRTWREKGSAVASAKAG